MISLVDRFLECSSRNFHAAMRLATAKEVQGLTHYHLGYQEIREAFRSISLGIS
jgi:hypothetical protein